MNPFAYIALHSPYSSGIFQFQVVPHTIRIQQVMRASSTNGHKQADNTTRPGLGVGRSFGGSSYVVPHRRKTEDKPRFTYSEKRTEKSILLLQMPDLDSHLKDLGIEKASDLFEDLECLSEEIGHESQSLKVIQNKCGGSTFSRPFQNKDFYTLKLEPANAEKSHKIASAMNDFFRSMSKTVSARQLQGLANHHHITRVQKEFLDEMDENNSIDTGSPPKHVGSFRFVACVTNHSDVENAPSEAKNVVKKHYMQNVNIRDTGMAVDSTSLALFLRPSKNAKPTHVLSWCCSGKKKGKRELVGGGHLNLALDESFAESARKKLYEETFGLVSVLPGGLPLEPVKNWRGKGSFMNWESINFAMVVTEDKDGNVRYLPEELNTIAEEVEEEYFENPFSIIFPNNTGRGYEWSHVDDFEQECRENLLTSWKQLYAKVVEENILSDY